MWQDMHVAPWLSKKILSIAHRRKGRKPSPMRSARDPDLVAMANIAQQRRLETARSLETVFEKVKPILRREKEPSCPVHVTELPPDLKARIAAMPNPEQRIRAIVEFRLSARTDSSQDD